MVAAVAQQFNAQREQILASLDTSKIGKSYTRKDYLDDLLDWAAADDSMKQALLPQLTAIVVESGAQAMLEVGKQPSMFDPYAEPLANYFASRSLKIAQDVNDETEKQLRAGLSMGIKEGWSIGEMRAMVEDIMGSASTMRADRIARTEVTRAQGFADIQAWKQSGVVSGKEWFTAEDEHVCPFCDSLDHTTYGLEEDVFSKGDSKTVDGQTQHYNYDDVPSPPLHVNCRCVLLPVR